MIDKDTWEAMTPSQQGDAWFFELGNMLRAAQSEIRYKADNEDTLVVSGMTTIVSERTDIYGTYPIS
jgi:hypothetical protein